MEWGAGWWEDGLMSEECVLIYSGFRTNFQSNMMRRETGIGEWFEEFMYQRSLNIWRAKTQLVSILHVCTYRIPPNTATGRTEKPCQGNRARKVPWYFGTSRCLLARWMRTKGSPRLGKSEIGRIRSDHRSFHSRCCMYTIFFPEQRLAATPWDRVKAVPKTSASSRRSLNRTSEEV